MLKKMYGLISEIYKGIGKLPRIFSISDIADSAGREMKMLKVTISTVESKQYVIRTCLPCKIFLCIQDFLPSKPPHVEILLGPVQTSSVQIQEPPAGSSCGLCQRELRGIELCCCYNNGCHFVAHVTCLASLLMKDSDLILPIRGCCPSCSQNILWGKLVKTLFCNA